MPTSSCAIQSGRGEVAHDAGREMLPRRHHEALGADDARVLQIALAPAAVARREIDQRGRALLVGAAERRQHVDRIAGAADQRRLDEIVAEDVAAERRLAGQVRQAAMVGEGARADDRVVAPVIAVAAHPGAAGPTAMTGPGDARRELLHAREHRVAVDDQRQALDDAGVGIGLHRRGEPDDRLAGHHAVGVEHQHVGVAAAPAGDEVGDIAGLAARVLAPAPIVDARFRQALAHGQERALLGDPDVGVGRVGQEEIVEGVAETGALDVLEDRLHGAEDPGRRLVVDRHDDGGLLARAPAGRAARLSTRAISQHEADDARGEGEGDPGKGDDEQDDHRPFEQGDRAADVDHLVHLEGAVDGQRDRAAEDEESA